MQNEWRDFNGGAWENEVNVRDFIQRNYKPYDGDSSFLEGPTEDTTALWQDVLELSKQEREAGGVLDMDTKIISTITSHGPAYLDKDKEKIVGFQTDKPFKRSLQPYGGIRMAIKACEDNGYKVDPEVVEYFTTHRKTHNAGVFDAYTPEMRACRSAHIITGLPDAYGRGRIIGDYRRPALYGVDRLIEDKQEQLDSTRTIMYSDVIREREELSEQIRALKMLKELAKIYGCDISKPATNVLEAAQAVYFAYLAAVKEQNGAAMSLGRTSTFLDIYAERDLREGTFTEKEIQEIIDQFVMKLRCVKFARTPEYNTIFAGDPTWVTESIAGIGVDGRHMVTKMSYRYLNTLNNIGAAPEPNMTVLWSVKLPENFKKFCAEISIKHSAIQYENDDIMRVVHGDDYGIACCVSSMRIGKTYTLKATVTPKDCTDKSVKWKSSKSSVVKVDANGKVTAKKAGTATITATTKNGLKATCKITVTDPATKVYLTPAMSIKKGSSVKLTASVFPKTTTDKLTWSTSNKKVVTVTKNGKIKGVKTGTATITVKTTSGKKATCKVTVVKSNKKSAGIKLSVKKLTLKQKATKQLKAALDKNATDKVTWSSSNKKVATVDKNGVVTAVKKGTVTITAKTSGGKKATCKVTVKVPATKVKLNKTKATVAKGRTLTLKATMTPSSSTDKLTWTSSNKKVATVDKNGKVKALKKGTATITVKTASGKKATCKITVK